ncbi:MAG: hypothetical protein UR49_C0007G0003 [candidate division WS6 bacterium GW2011_GWF2_33_92]|nr:MAG: hypothetical protein UR49_C0007G0003 [candidate division WS6 bacterium GW2011_GWF2_33_92]OGC36414.1 MAG: hypothetical protein A2369_01360 [candidate division WS6 bacterium RIFOXYB1_FULL_33_15]
MKKTLIILIVLLVIAISLIVLYLLKGKEVLNFDKVETNDPAIEKLVTISQSNVSAFIFVTQESENDHRLHINMTPVINLTLAEKEVENFKIENFKGDSKIGEVLLIHPTSLARENEGATLLFTEISELMNNESIQSNGDSIDYVVTDTVTKYNEVAKRDSIVPSFGIVVKSIGTVDYKNILDRDKVFEGSKYLEYSGIKLGDITTSIQFDLVMEFTDGTKYTKRFAGSLDGNRFSTETVPLFELKSVE